MKDKGKTKAQLIAELKKIRLQVSELKGSEKHFRDLAELLPEAVIVTDLNQNLSFANQYTFDLLGYSAEDLDRGLNGLELLVPEDRLKAKENIKKQLKGKDPGLVEYQALKKDGSSFPILFKSKPVIRKGKIVGLRGIAIDITERKQIERILKKEKEFTEKALNAQNDTFFLFEPSTKKALRWNRTFSLITGYNDDEIATMPAPDSYYSPQDLKRAASFIQEIQKKGKGIVELELIGKDGCRVPTEYNVSVIKDEEKNKEYLISIGRDITKRIRTEEALKTAKEFAENLLETANTMVITLDHNAAITIFNKYAENLTGYSKEEVIGKNWFTLFIPERHKNTIPNIFQEILQNMPEFSQYQNPIVTKNGDERLINWSNNVIRDSFKTIKGILSIGVDITERRKVEKALLQSEEKFKGLIESTSDWIWEVNTKGVYTYASPQVKTILGFTPDEIIGKEPFDFMPAQEAERIKRIFTDLVEKGKPIVLMENTLLQKSGKTIVLETSGVPFFDNDGKIAGYRGIDRDITERKKAERELQERQETINAIIETSQDWIWSINSQLIHTYSNPAIQEILGYKPEEIIGKSAIELMHPEDFNKLDKSLKRWQSEKRGWKNQVIRWKHQDSSYRYLESNAVPILDTDGNLTGYRGVDRDITKRKKAEEKLQESEERYRIVSELISDYAYAYRVEPNGKLINEWVTGSITRITKYTHKELESLGGWEHLIHPEDLKIPLSQLKILLSNQAQTVEYRLITKNGQIRWMRDYARAIWDEKANRVIRIEGAVQDITDRKQAEEGKTKLEEQLRRSQKLETIGTLAGGIAHDFNNILTPIMGYTDMAMLGLEKNDPLFKDLEQVLLGSKRARDLVEQILLFSKQAEKEQRPLSLQILITEALKLLRPSIPATVNIQQRIDHTCGKIMADATQIHQVIVNLCTNAWQSMEEQGGTISIELNQVQVDITMAKLHPKLKAGEYARLSVIDTGPGLDENTLERIFEPFFTTKTVDKGTGLGLSVVHGIVHSHKGDILVYSEPKKGSSFNIYLPILKTEEEISGLNLKEIARGKECILIVDDEPEIGKLVMIMLKKFGYQAEVHTNGLDALKAFKAQPDKYDLMICDFSMPQMTGLDLADRLHREFPKFPVIIMTGFGDRLTLPSQQRYGIKQVISKPIALKELAVTVRKVLDG